jgi:hypothetical protein
MRSNFRSPFDQAEFFIDTVSGYGSDFALFPEFFTAPLMADFNHLSEAEAIRGTTYRSRQIEISGVCYFLQY